VFVIEGCNILLGHKFANTYSFEGGRIIVQQEKLSREKRSWTNPLNDLQEAIHYCFIKFCIYCFSLWFGFFVHYDLRVENLSTFSWCGTFGISVSLAEGKSHHPIQNSVASFGVTGKTPGLFSRNNLLEICLSASAIAITSCQDVPRTSLCSSAKQCETKLHTNFPFQILFQNPENYSVRDGQYFCYHSSCDSTVIFEQISNSKQCLPQFESILDGHLSYLFLPAPFRL